MNILLSTNTFIETGYKPLKILLDEYQTFKFGLELFPNFENIQFNQDLEDIKLLIEDRTLSVHGPYFSVEHSAPKGSEAYDYAMNQIDKTLKLCESLDIHHLVFHHSNKEITEDNKAESIEESTKNLRELNEICAKSNVEILIENAGVYSRNNALLNESEFIEACLNEKNNVLIDIGHVNANGWSLENVIQSLKDKITHYHIHNNSGGRDDHNRINDGSLNFEAFKRLHNNYTPDATLVLEYNYDLGSDIEAIKADLDDVYESFIK